LNEYFSDLNLLLTGLWLAKALIVAHTTFITHKVVIQASDDSFEGVSFLNVWSWH
jgi:hypothetical protein